MLTKCAYMENIQKNSNIYADKMCIHGKYSKNSNIYADKMCIHGKYSLISIIGLKKFF